MDREPCLKQGFFYAEIRIWTRDIFIEAGNTRIWKIPKKTIKHGLFLDFIAINLVIFQL